jgi:hypothetical protein
MRRNTIAIVAILCGVAFLAIHEPRYKDLDKIKDADTATIKFPSGAYEEVDIEPIRDTLASAEWLSGTPINKGGYWIRIEGMPEIFLSEVNGCFWLTGYRGLFKIDEDRISLVYTYLDAQYDTLQRESATNISKGEQGSAHQSTTRPESKSERPFQPLTLKSKRAPSSGWVAYDVSSKKCPYYRLIN